MMMKRIHRSSLRCIAAAMVTILVTAPNLLANGPDGPEGSKTRPATKASLFAWNSRAANRTNERGLLDVRCGAFGVLVQVPCDECGGTLPRVYTATEMARLKTRTHRAHAGPVALVTISESCSDTSSCTSTPNCSDGNECTEGAFCSGGPQCTSGSGCSQGGDCTLGSNCSSGPTCTQGNECSTGWDCTAGTNCSSGGDCTEGPDCSEGRDCTEGTACSTGTNCTNGAQCSDHDECTTEGKCTNGPNCSTGNSCTSHGNCSEQSAKCTVAANCSSEQGCSDGGHCPPTKAWNCAVSVWPRGRDVMGVPSQLISRAFRRLGDATGVLDGKSILAVSFVGLLLPLGSGPRRRRREQD